MTILLADPRVAAIAAAEPGEPLMRTLTRQKQHPALLDVLASDHSLLRAEADLRWIDVAEARLNDVEETLT